MTAEFVSFEALAHDRRSIRQFRKDHIDPEVVRRLLALACRAPSAHNRQPWRFAVLETSQAKDRIARALGERLKADRMADGDDPQEVAADVARSYARITGAAVAVLICLTIEEMDQYADEKRSRAEYLMAVQGVAMAGHNLLMAAHAYGLGACWMCAPLFAPGAASEALNLPTNWEPQGLVLFGWPAGTGKERGRRAVEELSAYF